jgi:hypothetical protein
LVAFPEAYQNEIAWMLLFVSAISAALLTVLLFRLKGRQTSVHTEELREQIEVVESLSSTATMSD